MPPPRPRVFATLAASIFLFATSTWLALHAGSHARSYIPDLDVAGAPITRVRPVVGPPSRRLARRVVVVMIDGLRLDESFGRPFLDRLRERGVDTSAESHYLTMSRPNHIALVTGVEPRVSGVRTNGFRHPLPLDSVMARARAAGLRTTYVTDGAGGVLRLLGDDLDEGAYSPYHGLALKAAARALERGDELLLLWLGEVDVAGHAHGAASPEYRQAVRHVDQELAALLGGLDLDKDAIVVVADHGHIARGGHGGVEREVVAVPLILAGAGVTTGQVVHRARLIDVAPTVTALLGLPAPGHSLGRTLTAALRVTPDERVALEAADQARLAALAPMIDAYEADADREARRERERRGLVAVAVFLALAALAAVLERGRVIVLGRRVLLVAVPAFPLFFYGMLASFEEWLSPSMLPSGTGDVTRDLFTYGAIAAAGNLVAAWLALRGRAVHERLAATAGIVLAGLAVAAIPAGAAWCVSGRPLSMSLPGPHEIMMPPVTYSALTCYGLAAALLVVVELVVFFTRVTERIRRRVPAAS